MTKRTMPRTLRLYQALRRKKKSHCAGRATLTDVKKAKTAYVSAAVKGGQTKTDATKKADKVIASACGIASRPKKRRSAMAVTGVGKIKKRAPARRRPAAGHRHRKAA